MNTSNVPLSLYIFATWVFMTGYCIYMVVTSVENQGLFRGVLFLSIVTMYFTGVSLWREWKLWRQEVKRERERDEVMND